MSNGNYTPSDDLPKQNPWRHDRLGYAPFAKRLAQVVLSLKAPEGYVIGMHGEWGSGKTTALNFVKEYLQKHNVEAEDDEIKLEVIDFAPWIVSGHQDLISAFFKVLAEKMGKRPSKKSIWARWVKGSTEGIVTAVGKVGVLVDPTFGVASGAAKVVGTTFDKVLEKYLEEPSLQKAYQELKDELKAKGRKYLVIIDDIDRLQRDEIRYVMQMVKTVGRLPNVIYLLAYDRDIVWSALDEPTTAKRVGPNFAEKIVQHELELPKPLADDLLSILDKECAFLIGPTPNNSRWQYIVRDGVRRWIRHPRDIFRFANAMKFSWTALEGEIDPQDLYAMEGLRLFDEAIFNWLRWNRDFLFSEGQFFMADEALRKNAVDLLLKEYPDRDRAALRTLLRNLFPQRAEQFSDSGGAAEPYFETIRRRGIGSEDGYDAYFSLFPSPSAVSKLFLDTLMASIDDGARVLTAIDEYASRKDRRNVPMIAKLFQEMAFRFEGEALSRPTPALLSALVKKGEAILNESWDGGIFVLSPRTAYLFLIKSMLRAWGPDEATRQLEGIVDSEDDTSVAVTLVMERARELGEIDGGRRGDAVISAEAARSLAKKLLPKIEAMAADGRLSKLRYISHVLRCWQYAGGQENARSWIAVTVFYDVGVLTKIAEGHLNWTLEGERRYSLDSRPDPSLYDYDLLSTACGAALNNSALSGEPRKQVTAFKVGLDHLTGSAMKS